MTEAEFQRQARLYLGQQDNLVVWRNNVGKTVRLSMRELDRLIGMLSREAIVSELKRIKQRGLITYGLCPGSSDLVGVERRRGRMVTVELKTTERRESKEQEAFRNLVNECGGVGWIAKSMESLKELVELLND